METVGADVELLKFWFSELSMTITEYKEPILDVQTMELIKFACDVLEQDSHVFIMTVDIIDSCVRIMNIKNEKIEDQLLLICATIFICSKHVGAQSDLKTQYVSLLYERISKQSISLEQVKLTEMNVLEMLDQRLPLHSKIDDLKIFLENYIQPKILNPNVTELCVNILNLVYINYMPLFHKLKDIYNQNSSAFSAFKQVISNRFYLPCGILICAIHLAHLPDIDVNRVLEELCVISNIHQNHIELLAERIYSLIIINNKS